MGHAMAPAGRSGTVHNGRQRAVSGRCDGPPAQADAATERATTFLARSDRRGTSAPNDMTSAGHQPAPRAIRWPPERRPGGEPGAPQEARGGRKGPALPGWRLPMTRPAPDQHDIMEWLPRPAPRQPSTRIAESGVGAVNNRVGARPAQISLFCGPGADRSLAGASIHAPPGSGWRVVCPDTARTRQDWGL